jgi:hypothetical protein
MIAAELDALHHAKTEESDVDLPAARRLDG